MPAPFDSFVVFAEMRTGSNFLESNLNALEGATCHGEAFNPHFIGYPDCSEILGLSQKQRDRDPEALLDAIAAAPGLNGFRYFHDHDPRILDRLIADRRCAKIILTRDPLESYVSWKIAQTTGQWKLTDVKRRKEARVPFDPVEYAEHVGTLRAFQQDLTHRMQAAGQVPFRLSYDDLRSVEVINGLAMFLGVDGRLEQFDKALKVQNPASLADKVSNPEDMAAVLAARDARDLYSSPDFEPPRFANIPSYYTGAEAPLVFLPIPGGPTPEMVAWLAALDGVPEKKVPRKLTQKDLRLWKRTHPGHRSFTVLRHPLARAHHAFCKRILNVGPGTYRGLRNTLIRRYGLPLPEDGPDGAYELAHHRTAFKAFLQFLHPNLNGQTAVRVDASWCSQAQVLQGFARFAVPDLILREAELEQGLAQLAEHLGYADTPRVTARQDAPFTLDAVYDDEAEALGARAYQRDYMTFGFGPWR